MSGSSVGDGSGHTRAPALQDVLAELDSARRRALARGIVEAAVMAVAAGLAAWCLLRLGVAIAWTGTDWTTLALATAAVTAAAFAIGVVAALAESPSRTTLARRADARFGLRERLSTAIELAGTPLTPVSAALVADAERSARSIRPAAIVPGRRSTLALPLALLAVFAGVLLLAPLPPSATADRAAPPSVLVGAAEAEAIAAELELLATGIAADAAARDDAFLAAIAGAAADIAQRLAEGAPVPRDELAGELARLGDYAVTAYGAGGAAEPRAEALSRLAAATAAGLANSGAGGNAVPRPGGEGETTAGAGAAGAADPAAASDAGAGGPGAAAPEGAPAGDASPLANAAARPAARPEITGEAVQEPCNFDAGGDCAIAGGDNPFGLERGNVNVPPDPAGAAPPNAAEGPAMANGQLVGPAANAGAGEAVFAGQGTRPLGDVPADDPGPMADGGTMLLRDRGAGTGDRIRIDMPPPTAGAIALDGAAPPSAGARPTLPEAAVARPLLPPTEREVAARYFLRPPETE